ncbi:hypothetical protein D9757_012530 [Collybiopsis confluens]|uniref:2-isopropylmalate synthase n=1 Tax=Collybiopsis confluens TaxID=2823264 RepID=A0A8H5G1R1_9AGAR|nr:hypothetical protein D9757_012530 [Collybiopsis confluens]
MLLDPSPKYQRIKPVNLVDRQWPSRTIEHHPTWLSTDLRDGNQAIVKPMSIAQKLALFRILVERGFRQIEVAFPAASETEFGFVRTLIQNQEIPDGVAIQVITPARKDLILRSFEATRGAKHVLMQLYSSTAPVFRDVVYKNTNEDIIRMAAEHTAFARITAIQYSKEYGTEFQLVYAIEGFSQSDMDFVIKVCDAVKNAWDSHGPPTARPIIFNLPASVECGPANHYADQVEYIHKNLPNRDQCILSVHVHNDRGTAVAATEQALLAGAERVEGCLFGNGERTGNVDLVTVALNLYSQGVAPGLDFSRMDELVQFMTQVNGIPVHPRHPYAGELVYTAFSGGHQDGIRKGLHLMENSTVWAVPYLPLDPTDFGRVYEARINSQSGKGGAAYVLEQSLDIYLPRSMQMEVSKAVQLVSDSEGRELPADEICTIFSDLFDFHDSVGRKAVASTTGRVSLQSCEIHEETMDGVIVVDQKPLPFHTTIQSPAVIKTCLQTVNGLGLRFKLLEEEQRSSILGFTSLVHLEIQSKTGSHGNSWWGAGRAKQQPEATLRAAISAVNGLLSGKGIANAGVKC